MFYALTAYVAINVAAGRVTVTSDTARGDGVVTSLGCVDRLGGLHRSEHATLATRRVVRTRGTSGDTGVHSKRITRSTTSNSPIPRLGIG